MSQIAKVFTSKAATAKAAKTKAATAKAKAKAAKAKAANAKAVKAAAAMAVKAKKSAKAKALQAAKFAKQAAKAKVAQAAQDKLAKQAAKTKTAKAKAAQAAKLAKQAAKAKAVQGKSAKAKAVQAAKFAKQAAKAKAAQAAQDKLAKQSAKTKTAKAKAAQAAKLAKQAAKAKALQKKVAKAKAVQAARDKLVKQAAKAKAVQAARDKAKQAAKAKAVQAARDKAKQAALQKKAAKTTTSQAAQKNLVQVAKAPRTATTTLKRISAPPKIRHMLARTQEKKARFEALVGSRLADLRKSAFENRTFPVVRTEQRYDFLRSTPNEPILHLIDASDWIYRSYFSIPQYLPNNAVHGFLRALILHVECMGPKDKLMLCFDSGRTWRNAEAPEYKTGRKSYPHLKKQLPLCRTAAQQLVGVKHCMSVVGMEADDIIAEIAKTSDCKVAIHANDQDFLQLVNDRVCLLRKKKDEQKQEHYHVFGANEVRNTFYGLHPSELCDYWALVGQPSDAIKGVAGVGPVKAADLILTLGNIKEVFNENRRDQVVSIVGNKGTKEIGKKETQKLCLIGRNVMTLPSFRTPKQLNLGFKKPQDMDFRFNPKRLHALVELLTKVNADSLIKMAESVIKAREKKLGKNRTRVGLSCKGSAKKRKSRSWYAEQMAIAKKMGKGSIIKNIV